jgi:hypothetical protein
MSTDGFHFVLALEGRTKLSWETERQLSRLPKTTETKRKTQSIQKHLVRVVRISKSEFLYQTLLDADNGISP